MKKQGSPPEKLQNELSKTGSSYLKDLRSLLGKMLIYICAFAIFIKFLFISIDWIPTSICVAGAVINSVLRILTKRKDSP